MKRMLYFVGLLIWLLFGCIACGAQQRQIQADVANGIADAGNTALPMLVAAYQKEGSDAIAASSSRAEAEVKLYDVKKRWEPRWLAWESLRIAHDSWAVALEKDLDLTVALAQLRKAYCELVDVWPESLPALPVVPLACPATRERNP